ncbi:aliphatic sulfonate ABC transporter substrate-binding protein [soil metagenome]
MQQTISRLLAVSALGFSIAASSASAADLKEVAVGFTSIVPETLLVKQKGWIEEALKPRGISVKWVESLGSNKTIEFLRGKSLDIGPSSSASAFLARANGTPIKYVLWSARMPTGSPILVRKDSPYQSIADLKGKKIAATPGTGPYISLIAALHKHGLDEKTAEVVSLQHAQGRLALASGRVEAWAALDPDWAIAELQNNAKVLYADKSLAGGGGYNVREEFLAEHPDVVKIVLAGFDRARIETRDHQADAIKAYIETSKVDPAVAQLVFSRNDTSTPQILPKDVADLQAWGEIYKKLGSIPADTDVAAVAKATLDASVFKPSAVPLASAGKP